MLRNLVVALLLCAAAALLWGQTTLVSPIPSSKPSSIKWYDLIKSGSYFQLPYTCFGIGPDKDNAFSFRVGQI